MGTKQSKSLNQIGLHTSSKYLDQDNMTLYLTQSKPPKFPKLQDNPVVITPKELEREYESANYGALTEKIDSEEMLSLLLLVFRSQRFKVLTAYLQDFITLFEESEKAKSTNLKRLDALKPILYLSIVETLVQKSESLTHPTASNLIRVSSLCMESLEKFIEVFSPDCTESTFRGLLLMLSRASLTLLAMPDLCVENSSLDSTQVMQDFKSPLMAAIAELDGLTASQHVLNTLTDPLRQPDYFARTARDWILITDQLANNQNEAGGAVGRIRYLFRRYLLAKYATQTEVEPFVFKEQTLVTPTFSIKTFPFADNIKIGVLEINSDNVIYTMKSFWCLLYTRPNVVDLHQIEVPTDIRLRKYYDGSHAPSSLKATLAQFISATVGRPFGLDQQDQVSDYTLTLLHTSKDMFYQREYSMSTALTDAFSPGSHPACAYIRAYLCRPLSCPPTHTLTVAVTGCDADQQDDGVYFRRKQADELQYVHLFRGDGRVCTFADLLAFVVCDVFGVQPCETAVFVQQLRRRLRFRCGVGSARAWGGQFGGVGGYAAVGLAGEAVGEADRLVDVRDRILGGKQNLESQEGFEGFRPVDLVAIIEESDELEFDLLPAHVGKYRTKIKYPLDQVVNHLVTNSVAWQNLDVEDDEQQIKNCLPESIYLDMTFLKQFCKLTRKLEIDVLKHLAEAAGITHKFLLEGVTFSFEVSKTKLNLMRLDHTSSMLYPCISEKDRPDELNQQCIMQVLRDSNKHKMRHNEAHLEALGLIIEARKFAISGEEFPPEILSDKAKSSALDAFSSAQKKWISLLATEGIIDEKVISSLKNQKDHTIGFLPEDLCTNSARWACFSRL